MILVNGKEFNIGRNSIKAFNYCGIKYSIDFEKEIIEVKADCVDKHINARHKFYSFGKYKAIFDDCYRKIRTSYRVNKKSGKKLFKKDYHLFFLDEIKFVGLMYIDFIEKREPKDMPVLYDFSDDDIKNEYKRMKHKMNMNPFFNDIDSDDWWIDETVQQTIDFKPMYYECLACFIKKEHKICVCDKNIKKTYTALDMENRDDGLFLNSKDILEKCIMLHEIGHSVFQKADENSPYPSPILSETRANYFVSLISVGQYDYDINTYTKYQSFIYRFPFLSFSFTIGEMHYSRKFPCRFNLLEEYEKKVGELYE